MCYFTRDPALNPPVKRGNLGLAIKMAWDLYLGNSRGASFIRTRFVVTTPTQSEGTVELCRYTVSRYSQLFCLLVISTTQAKVLLANVSRSYVLKRYLGDLFTNQSTAESHLTHLEKFTSYCSNMNFVSGKRSVHECSQACNFLKITTTKRVSINEKGRYWLQVIHYVKLAKTSWTVFLKLHRIIEGSLEIREYCMFPEKRLPRKESSIGQHQFKNSSVYLRMNLQQPYIRRSELRNKISSINGWVEWRSWRSWVEVRSENERPPDEFWKWEFEKNE